MALEYKRDSLLRVGATAAFMIAIALIGAFMMGVTSSPAVKGAALLWLPAALQLMAGVWLGPTRGFVAGAFGAQAAGVLAYGGWAPSDWIMNFVAGGLANSALPALLFAAFRLDPAFPAPQGAKTRGTLLWTIGLTIAVVAVAFIQKPLLEAAHVDMGTWGYVLPLLFALIPIVLGLARLGTAVQFSLAVVVVVLICFVSASIGVVGAVVGGQTLEGAVVTVGIGWFMGDTVSCIIGLYALAALTPWARERGFAPIYRPA
jgi:hypothetical protein